MSTTQDRLAPRSVDVQRWPDIAPVPGRSVVALTPTAVEHHVVGHVAMREGRCRIRNTPHRAAGVLKQQHKTTPGDRLGSPDDGRDQLRIEPAEEACLVIRLARNLARVYCAPGIVPI